MNNGTSGGDKRQTAFIFTCIGGILYVVPAVSALYLGVVTDGWGLGFILGMAAMALGIPNSLFAMNAYGKKRHRALVCVFDAVLIALHLAVLPMIGTWYLILSPALILLVLMIVFSGVIENH
ncbi:MAG: hypothetical protein IIU08_00810 [Clostridia bacterium]|nr:hypothetical protein [Clostridia bacterium]MBQ5354392.1 hypothetical protein [Clostridia bacterium]